MASWSYEFRIDPKSPIQQGEIEAESESAARRKLRVMLMSPQLPDNTKLVNLTAERESKNQNRTERMRYLTRMLAVHAAWLAGQKEGERADLARTDLSELDLSGMDLSNAELSGTDFSDASLRGAKLRGASLAGAILRRADLSDVDLTGADLSHADLREADLANATLTGADLWRANLLGVRIDPEVLHAVLQCKPVTRRKSGDVAVSSTAR